jgi:prophage regulatory protein
MTEQIQPLKILRRRQVEERTGLTRSVVYSRLKYNPKRPNEYDETFPHPISLGGRAVGWLEGEIDAWLAAQAGKRDAARGAPK